MNNQDEMIRALLARIESLSKRQDNFKSEIESLRNEIYLLRNSGNSIVDDSFKPIPKDPIVITEPPVVKKETYQFTQSPTTSADTKPIAKSSRVKEKSDLEKFIGENLINKIGIFITVIGVAIGAKYSIDHDLISPLTRIILGYLLGIGLLGVGIKLKAKYENYSAGLVAGAMAVMYIITFTGYILYGLFPQLVAFILMVIFTIFTVIAAINYNLPVIAHIGLVGAYAVPFLLSDGSGRVAILFSYMSIINIGILALSFRKNWKSLYYSAFGITWLVFSTWHTSQYKNMLHFPIAITFLCIFFATFYVIFLAYKLIKNEKFAIEDIILLLLNSFLFFAFGYAVLNRNDVGRQLLGAFTLTNGVIHFAVCALINKRKLADKNLFYLVAGLVLLFITITIPVQLDGNWVTLLWAGEATLLFWIGRTKTIPVYEKLSYPLMALSFISLIMDWFNYSTGYYTGDLLVHLTPILNIAFLSSMLYLAAFVFIYKTSTNEKYPRFVFREDYYNTVLSYIVPVILILTTYFTFRNEIMNYFEINAKAAIIKVPTDIADQPNLIYHPNIWLFERIWLMNYSLMFIGILSLLNLRKINNKILSMICLSLGVLFTLGFMEEGIFALNKLRDNYILNVESQYFSHSHFNIAIRYILFAFAGFLLYSMHKIIRKDFMQTWVRIAFDILLHITIIVVLSNELLTWTKIGGSTQSDKLGLSILWGFYSLMLIVLGIYRKQQHVRIIAFVLFGITLLKLLIYDLTYMDTIGKTIVFVSLGILLLIISFLYNKYKHLISGENEN